jgi:CheY-like chemotaxis protein
MKNTEKRPAHVVLVEEIKKLERQKSGGFDMIADYAKKAAIGGFLHILMNIQMPENDKQEVIDELKKLNEKYPNHGYEKTIPEIER